VNNTSPQHMNTNPASIFAQLRQQDVEEFYIDYQYWNLQHQIEILQYRLKDVHKQITENTERIQELQPTAIELATLARLQSNGVSNVDLLERMLERGESWLDRTMQRLDYLEQLDDFISDDYTQWCQHALEGAYDWIDSVLDGNALPQPSTCTASATTEDAKEGELLEATEELFLQKISTDEDEALMQEITMKHPSITTVDLDEVVPTSEDIPAGVDVASKPEKATSILEETPHVHTTEDTKTSHCEEDARTENTAHEEPLSVESNSTSAIEHPVLQEPAGIAPVAQNSSSLQANSTFEYASHKRPGFMKRFFGKVWGS
jgi:hypothetical protein